MFKYPNLLRLRYPKIIPIRNDKRYATPSQEKDFFKRSLFIQEKLDGSQCAVSWKGGMPYVQGRSGHIDQNDRRIAYKGLWNWVWEHTAEIEELKDYLIFGEWLKVKHHIKYDKLPDFFIAFDFWHKKLKCFMSQPYNFKNNISIAPTLYIGRIRKGFVPSLVEWESYYSSNHMEGCVLKDYNTQTFFKFVSREFYEGVNNEPSYWTSGKNYTLNELKKPEMLI